MTIFANQLLSTTLLRVHGGFGSHMRADGSMFGNNWGWGGGLMQVFMWLLVLATIVAVTLFVARISGKSGRSGSDSSALEKLNERYAQGTIDREEYLQRKKDIMDR